MGKETSIQKRPIENLKAELERPVMVSWLQKQITASMGRNATQLINIVLNAARNNEKLGQCTPSSILNCLCISAQIGLVPNTALQHAHIVPFLNSYKKGNDWVKVQEATLILGYPGLVKLIHDASGAAVKAAPVFDGEPFDYNRAGNPPVTLHKHAEPGKLGDIRFAYCLVHYPSGITAGEVYDLDFINARRAKSKSYMYEGKPRKDSPWVTNYPAMALKTAIRAYSNQIPKGNDARLERAIEVDDLDSHDSRLNVAALVDERPPLDMSLDDLDAGAIESGERPQLEAGEVERWIALVRETSDQRSLDEVLLQINKMPKGDLRSTVERTAIEHQNAMREGGRR